MAVAAAETVAAARSRGVFRTLAGGAVTGERVGDPRDTFQQGPRLGLNDSAVKERPDEIVDHVPARELNPGIEVDQDFHRAFNGLAALLDRVLQVLRAARP